MQRNDTFVSTYDTTKKKMHLFSDASFFEGLPDSTTRRTGRPLEDPHDLKVLKDFKSLNPASRAFSSFAARDDTIIMNHEVDKSVTC